jgi:hypothetical protein
MKKTLSLLCLMISSISFGILASNMVRYWIPRGPKLDFLSLSYNLGEIEPDDSKTIFVRFRNKGDRPLLINNVGAPCNCIEVTFPQKPCEPNEQGTIKITYQTKGLAGYAINQKMYIRSNDKNEPIKVLTLTGRVKSSIAVIPNKVKFGKVVVGCQPQKSIIIANLNTVQDFKITSAQSDIIDTKIFVTDANESDVPPGFLDKSKACKIVIKLPPLEKKGPLKGNLRIETNVKRNSEVVVPITGNVTSAVEIMPQLLFYTVKKPFEESVKLLRISAPHAVHVIPATSDPVVQCRASTIGPTKSWIFECTLSSEFPSKDSGMVTFAVTGLPHERLLSVPYLILHLPSSED